MKRIREQLHIGRRLRRDLLERPDGYLRVTGWYLSYLRQRPINADGAPIPWINHSALCLLEGRLRPDMTVAEYGAGQSTLYFAARCRSVQTVEHDPAWHDEIAEQLPANVRLLQRPLDPREDYLAAPLATASAPDVVFVDGRHRVEAVRYCLGRLPASAVLIVDDSHRERYRPAIAESAAHGYRALGVVGLKNGCWDPHETTFLYRPGNVFGF